VQGLVKRERSLEFELQSSGFMVWNFSSLVVSSRKMCFGISC
jgi:hypothetical protein